jgi:hypothetical protein
MRARCSLSFLVLLLLVPAVARAGWEPVLQVGSDFPVSASVGVSARTPFGLELSGNVGTLPGAYADVINSVAVSMGGYDEQTAELIRKSLRSSLVLSTAAGYDVVSRLRLHADYTIVSLGGATTTPDIVATVAGVPLPLGQRGRTFDISSTLQMLGLGVSWPFGLTHGMQLRVGLGARFTVAASTHIQSSGTTTQDETYARDAEQYLDDIYTSYAHTPVLSLQFEYGF